MGHDDTPWWRTFFHGSAVDFWLAATPVEQSRQEAEFVCAELGVDPPARLLDVPCGGGRHCRALGALGYSLTGVDISTDFLAAARRVEAPIPIAWEQREMRDLPWSAEFDGAYCLGNSFGYDDDAGNLGFLRSVARALRPKARFVLESGYIAEALLPTLQPRGWYDLGGMTVLSDRRYDHIQGRLHVEYRFLRGGTTESRAMSARLYTFREVCAMLETVGLTVVNTYSSFAREPFKLGSPRLIVVAEKPL